MFDYEGTHAFAVVLIVYSQVAKWRRFTSREYKRTHHAMQLMDFGTLLGFVWENITYEDVRSILCKIGGKDVSTFFKQMETWRETLKTAMEHYKSMEPDEDFTYEQCHRLMMDGMYPYARGDENLNPLGVPFQPLAGVISAMVISVSNALDNDGRERVARSLYNVGSDELGGDGEESVHLLVKFLLVNLNRVELLEFLALAPEFLVMIRDKKREFFLNAYMGGHTTMILAAVRILYLSVEEMTPPEREIN